MRSKRVFHCKLCPPAKGNLEYSDLSDLRTHQWKEHRSHYKNVGQNNPKSDNTLGTLLSSATGIKCTMCDSLLKNEASLKTHMRGVHGVFKRAAAPVNGNGKGHETVPEPDKSLYAVQVEGLVEIAQMIRDLSEERKSK